MSHEPKPQPITLPLDVLAGLYAVGTGQVHHVFNGLCPDQLEGPLVRDEDCPACRALMAVDGLLRSGSGSGPASVPGLLLNGKSHP